MAVAATSSSTQTGAAGSTSGSNSGKTNGTDTMMNGVSKSDFMKLLVAELRNQDPFKPMEDKEFIAQMAQLSTLETVSTMNTTLNTITSLEMMGQASSLIGKKVEAVVDSETFTGVVDQVVYSEGSLILRSGDKEFGLGNVSKIVASE